MNLLKKSLNDTFLYFLGTAGSKILSFLIIPFINTFFTVEEFGRYDLFLITVSFISLAIGLGFDSGFAIIIVDNKDNKKLLGYLFTRSLWISLIFLALISFFGYGINNYYNFFSQIEFFLLIMYVFTTYVSLSVFNFIRWLGKAKQASFINFISSSLGIVIGLVFVFFSTNKEIEKLFLGMTLGSFIGMIICLFVAREYLIFKKLEEGKSKLKELVSISIPFVPTYLSNYLVAYSDRILILTLIGDMYFVGLYALLYRIAQIGNLMLGILSKGFLPVMYNNYNTVEGKLYNKKVFDYFNLLLVPLFFFILLIKDFLIKILSGKNSEDYLSHSDLLPAIFLAIIIFGGMGINGFGYTIKRKTIYISFITFAGVLLNFLLSYVLIKYLGFSAIIISTLVTSIFSTIIYTFYSEKLYKFNYNKLIMIGVYISLFVLSVGLFYFDFFRE
ncbi:oligosaccharide flippase family protein [Aquimarina megaterium]|uniref:oligosaccharide flippase family protein n=1 Tax=Aquimarina megaterium TaxID=1443666 RepID=UPI0004705452|nr:oligosaccharide flippase family protein [Aquimarina megaterium]